MAQHERLVLRTALRLTGHLEDAQDASQEVFLRLFRHIENVAPATVEAWLYRTTVNVCMDYHRRRPRESEMVVEPSVEAAGTDALENAAKRRLLEAGLAHLSPQERAAVVLCSIEGLSTAAAAAAMGIAEGTVRSHLSLARTRLKEYVGRFWR